MPRYEILIRAEFSAAHQLRLASGRLEPLHGHNWEVEVTIQGDQLDEIDVLADFTEVKPQLRAITDSLHDSFLNEHAAFQTRNPSTELVAKLIHDQFALKLPPHIRISRVRVYETQDCAADYIP